MNRRPQLLLAVLAALVVAGFLLRPAMVESAKPIDKRALAAVRDAGKKIVDLHQKKSATRPGDWLAEHEESGQTFEQYLRANSARARDRYQTLYVQPLGEFTKTQRRLIEQTAECLGLFYATPVKVLDDVTVADLPAGAQRVHPSWGDRQLLSTYLLDPVLLKRRKDDALAVLGLTAMDLWPGEGWNFVFGQASLVDRVGVWSLYRNGEPEKGDQEYTLCLRRTLKTALHETGHMLGMHHCIAHECGMNGSNHREESDRGPLYFCAECEQKVWWTCRADVGRRYAALADFAEKNRLAEEARFWRASEKRFQDKR